MRALVAIGGLGMRLASAGIPVPGSKVFLRVGGLPLLHWCLRSLHLSGVEDVVLAHTTDTQRSRAESVLSNAGLTFESVRFFRDSRLGAHGLPYHCRELLTGDFIFEAGHNISHPDHYRSIMRAKSPGGLVWTLFPPDRLPMISFPAAVDDDYATLLPHVDFKIDRALTLYDLDARLRTVSSTLPKEFDDGPDFKRAMRVYRENLRATGTPWGEGARFTENRQGCREALSLSF